MPIRPENRGEYPDDWAETSRRIRFGRAGGRCEWVSPELGERCEARHGEPHPLTNSHVVLTCAHMDGFLTDHSDGNLKALCQLHHNRRDAPMRAAGIKQRRRKVRATKDMFEP